MTIVFQVLHFKDFSPCSVSQASLNALTSIDWSSYGLTLGSVVDQVDHALIEWESLPPHLRIDMVLHCYHKQYPTPCYQGHFHHCSWPFCPKMLCFCSFFLPLKILYVICSPWLVLKSWYFQESIKINLIGISLKRWSNLHWMIWRRNTQDFFSVHMLWK